MTLFVIAMLSEANAIIKEFKLIKETPYKLYKKENILVALTGIGKVNSALVTSIVASEYKVSNIVNLGFVGAFGDYKVGQIVKVKDAVYHDFDLTVFGYEKGQVPNLPTVYHSNESIISKLSEYNETTLYTGDYFMMEKLEGNYIADMEGVAIFQVAHLLNIPMISVKVVSDIIGSDEHINDYINFEEVGSSIVFEAYEKIMEVL